MKTILFLNTTFIQLLELFFWILGAFLIGLYFGRVIGKNSKKAKTSVFEDITLNESLDLTHDVSKIRATKTFERGGKETVKTIIEPKEEIAETEIIEIKETKVKETKIDELNFSHIGKATIDEKDDLTKIKGIGPCIEQKLNGIGIYTFKQISNFNTNDITKITDLIKYFPNSIEKYDWVGQAFKLMNEDI